MATEAKQQAVAEVKEKIAKAQSVVLADYRGLTVAQSSALRTELRKVGVELKVFKNTLTKIAVKELGIDGLDVYLEGPTVMAFGYDDAVAPAKSIAEFVKTNKDVLVFKGGLVEGKVINPEGVKALAELPSREVLLAKVLGGMSAPLSQMASVLAAPMRSVVMAVDAIRKQKEEQQ